MQGAVSSPGSQARAQGKGTARTKLVGGGYLSAVLTLVVGLSGYWGLQALSNKTQDMLTEEAKIAEHAARVRANTLGLRRFEKDVFLNFADPKKIHEYGEKFKETQGNL